jgi:diguanylate cyclase (GGDEF)-like protein
LNKNKLLGWTAAVICTLIPIYIAHRGFEFIQDYRSLWTFFMIPSIILMRMYPRRLTIYGTLALFMPLAALLEYHYFPEANNMVKAFDMTRPFVNITLHLTIGYLLMTNQKLVKKVKCMSYTDSLTGVRNRRFFDEFIQTNAPPLLLILIDIDYFKKINDTYGHACGDQALQWIAQIIQSQARETDRVARIGGEEFAVLLPNTLLPEGLEMAERLRQSVANHHFTFQQCSIPITVSIGISELEFEKKEELVRRADQALYQAKANGRNQVVVK